MAIDERRRGRYFNLSCVADWAGRNDDYEDDDENTELEQLINDKLNSAAISDYAPNGLQVEGKETVHKIVTGVTASRALLDEAVRQQADAVIVHHGYFWKGESPVIRGMKRNRLKTLLENDINLYGWHLPLDAHPELGNNAQLAALLGITVMGKLNRWCHGRTLHACSGAGAGIVD